MKGDRTDSDLQWFWSRPKVEAKPADLYEGSKTLDLKTSDYLYAEAMAAEMKIPVGAVVGYAGTRLMAKCRRKDPTIPMPIENELVEIEKDLLPTEEAKSVKIQAPEAFFKDLELYIAAFKEAFGAFTYQAFFRKAIRLLWEYRKNEAEKSARRKEMSGSGKGDVDSGEKKV